LIININIIIDININIIIDINNINY